MDHICIIDHGLKVCVAPKYCSHFELSSYPHTEPDLKGEEKSHMGTSHDCHTSPSHISEG